MSSYLLNLIRKECNIDSFDWRMMESELQYIITRSKQIGWLTESRYIRDDIKDVIRNNLWNTSERINLIWNKYVTEKQEFVYDYKEGLPDQIVVRWRNNIVTFRRKESFSYNNYEFFDATREELVGTMRDDDEIQMFQKVDIDLGW
jgi:hypothetical protein